MGYPVLRIYPLPFLLVCLASACGFAVMLVQRSTLGVVYVSFMLVTQLLTPSPCGLIVEVSKMRRVWSRVSLLPSMWLEL